MAGLFSRLKVWSIGETVTQPDLNAEFNNIIANVDSEHAEGYSSNLTEMQSTEDPGGLGTEVLTQPISTAQEIKRLRFAIARAFGVDNWYEAPAATLSTLNDSLEQAFFISPSRIISGAHSGNSSQPKFLKAEGAAGVTLLATSTPFSAFIDGILYTFSADIDLTGLSSAITSGNTATLADNFSANAQYSKSVNTFNISGAGAEITANIGRSAIFKIVNGGNTEYFMGTVASSSQITNIYRGYLFDSTNAPTLPITLTTGHTITILRMTYIFLHKDGYLAATYNPLRYGNITPAGASIGDYWFDENVSMWKTYNGTAWIQANSIFVGVVAQESANTVVARSNEFYHQYSEVNDVYLDVATSTTVSSSGRSSGNVSVYGTNLHTEEFKYLFDITSDLVSGETEQASTTYYLYLTERGVPKMSSQAPILRKDLKGYYHSSETWRCVGSAYNNGSSNLVSLSVMTYGNSFSEIIPKDTRVHSYTLSGANTTEILPSVFSMIGRELSFERLDSTLYKLILDGDGSETINGKTTRNVATQYERLTIRAATTGWIVVENRIPSQWNTYTPALTAWGTPTDVTFWWKRNGKRLAVKGRFTPSTATGSIGTVELPTLLTIDATTNPEVQLAGWYHRDLSANDHGGRLVSLGGDAFVSFTSGLLFQATPANPFTPVAANSIGSQEEVVEFEVDIDGWEG